MHDRGPILVTPAIALAEDHFAIFHQRDRACADGMVNHGASHGFLDRCQFGNDGSAGRQPKGCGGRQSQQHAT